MRSESVDTKILYLTVMGGHCPSK